MEENYKRYYQKGNKEIECYMVWGFLENPYRLFIGKYGGKYVKF